MTSSMGNPHFLPAVCIQVTLINFTVIFDGLQEQLLSTVVRQVRGLTENSSALFNPLTAKLFNWNFHSLEVVDRVSET